MSSAVRQPPRQDRILALAGELARIEAELESLAAGEIDAIVNPGANTPILLRNAQVALARSEARFRNLVVRCPAIVCELSADGTTHFVNPALHTLLGYYPREVEGRNWWSFLIPDPRPTDCAALSTSLELGDMQGRELPTRHKDGSTRWLAWTSTRLDGTPDLPTFLLFGVDVTQRKLAEQQARELEAAQAARDLAEEANASKAQFLAVMSHELRTPLNAISGYAELIELGLRGPVTEAQINDLQRIRRSKEHLLGLINDILSFARIEAGSVHLQIEPVCVDEVLHTVRSLVEPALAEKRIEFTAHGLQANLLAYADRERMQQILTNLISNAIKFTPESGTVTLSCSQQPGVVIFEVTDTGVGIPPDKLESVFEPFVQVNHGRVGRNDGIGLGLYISRSLSEAMGGSLVAASTLGSGSTFTLTLPATRPN